MKRKPDVGEERKKLVSPDNNEKMSGGHKASGRKRKSIEIYIVCTLLVSDSWKTAGLALVSEWLAGKTQ